LVAAFFIRQAETDENLFCIYYFEKLAFSNKYSNKKINQTKKNPEKLIS
jgi:hypothetical protein